MKKNLLPLAMSFILGAIVLTSSAPPKKENSIRHDLYVSGQKAYENKNFVDAIKYLNTYKLLNEKQLSEFEGLAQNLEEQIQFCENQLRKKIILIQESEEKKVAYLHGNGYSISPYVKDYLENSKIDSTIVIHETPNSTIVLFGAKGYATPEAYMEFISKTPAASNQYNFIIRENGKFVLDQIKLGDYLSQLNSNNTSPEEIASLKNTLELQFHIQKIEVLQNEEHMLIDKSSK